MKSTYKTLYLIDISSFIFRAFYAVRELTAPDGTPVNAVYGVASMLGKLIDECDPHYLAVVYDSKEPSFRKIKYPEYKANRSAAPEALVPQFDLISTLIQKMGIPSFLQSGVEADDLIATLNKKWLQEDPQHRVVVVTGDKDLMALVSAKTQVWDTMKDVHYTEHEVIQKFGVHPSQIRDYLAMVGDSSDNIPGITGIGPKGAEALLKEFESLDGVITASKTGKIKGKKSEQILSSIELAKLSQELATLQDDLNLNLSAESARFQFQVKPELLEFFKQYNFKGLLNKFQAKSQMPVQMPVQITDQGEVSPNLQSPSPCASFQGVFTLEELRALIQKVKNAQLMAFDTETTSLNPREAQLVGLAIAVPGEEVGYYIPVGHQQLLDSKHTQLELDVVLSELKSVLEDPQIKKVGQNYKYDFRVMQNQGVHLQGLYADTMMAAYVIDSSGRHGLDYLASKYLQYTMLSYEEVTGKGASQISFDQVPIETAIRYSAEDAWATLKLWQVLEPKVKEQQAEKLFREVDLPLVEVVSEMEEVGIKVDVPFLKKLEQQFETELAHIEKKILKLTANPSLNLNSTKQLAQFLFEELKLPVQSKTKTGYSTDASVLEALAPLHEAPRMLLEYREISKLKSTYVLPLQQLRDPKDFRIRTSFNLTGTATGRLSSTDPNLQNIPIRSERGQLIRQAFVAEDGYQLISADYSQIELRILAHLSGDEQLVSSFVRDEDVHRRTASEIYGIAPAEVSDAQRSVAKAINFGLMYGKTAFGLAEELHISRTEAKEMIDRYFTRYRGVRDFLSEQVAQAHVHKYVVTLLGRKRSLPEIASQNHAVRTNAERMAMNSPIQGTASDLIKVAMVELHRQLQQQNLKAKLLLQVHDELILEAPEAEVQGVKSLLVQVMEGALKLKVPLKVNVGMGKNWAEI